LNGFFKIYRNKQQVNMNSTTMITTMSHETETVTVTSQEAVAVTSQEAVAVTSQEAVAASVKLTKKQKEVDTTFSPDEHGYSEWVSREKIAENKILDWGKNGAARHGIYFADKRYNWEKQGEQKITALRTVGFSDDQLYGAQRPIRKDIHEYHKQMGCVVCGSRSDLVTDHKNDLYNDIRVLDAKAQTNDDFQCLCNHCNLQKRQVSKKTKEIGKRIGAMTIPSLAIFGIDFVEGDDSFDPNDINAMVGTYWYDPVEFMKKLKSRL
jgi:5-methylcytosine-specific restriction endonuclease McrA